jgi:hypothetical protein
MLLRTVGDSASVDGNYVFSSANHSAAVGADKNRLAELESQNSDLQRLVADLLITNQRLRERTTKGN